MTARPRVPIPAAPGLPMPVNVLEHGKAESDNPLVLFPRRREVGRMNGPQHLMDAAGEQLVFVPEVRIKG